jgi:hypothetical protein
VEQTVCDFARQLLLPLQQGNIDGLLALSEPIAATCPSAGFGGPSPALCAGAVPGEVRHGYRDVQGGEGLIVTEAEWRRTLARWTAGIAAAQGSDVYGAGRLRIGGVSCGRALNTPSGRCEEDDVRIQFTFINSPAASVEQGTGIPGRRVSFHVALKRGPADQFKVIGSGTVVPPNTVLLDWEIEVSDASGRRLVVQYYPWTP